MTTHRVAQQPHTAQVRTAMPRHRDLLAQERRNAEALAFAALLADMDEANEAAEEVPEC